MFGSVLNVDLLAQSVLGMCDAFLSSVDKPVISGINHQVFLQKVPFVIINGSVLSLISASGRWRLR